MGNQLPELEKLFDDWTAKHEKLLSQKEPYFIDHEPPFGKFIRDGVVNMDEWKKQKVRICFVLSEASGYDDLEKFPNGADVAADWNEKGCFSKMMLMLATWTKAIFDSTNSMPIPYAKKALLKQKHDLIRSIAVVNVKKSDGKLATVGKNVANFATEDAEEIRKELEIIKANIIVVSVDLKKIVGDRPENETENSRRKFVFYNDEIERANHRSYKWGKNKLIINLWSPAQNYKPAASKVVNYYAVREIVREGIKSFQAPEKKLKVAKSKNVKSKDTNLKAKVASENDAAAE